MNAIEKLIGEWHHDFDEDEVEALNQEEWDAHIPGCHRCALEAAYKADVVPLLLAGQGCRDEAENLAVVAKLPPTSRNVQEWDAAWAKFGKG